MTDWVTLGICLVGSFLAGHMIGFWRGWIDGYWTPHPDSNGELPDEQSR